jgi:hypothetical protein
MTDRYKDTGSWIGTGGGGAGVIGAGGSVKPDKDREAFDKWAGLANSDMQGAAPITQATIGNMWVAWQAALNYADTSAVELVRELRDLIEDALPYTKSRTPFGMMPNKFSNLMAKTLFKADEFLKAHAGEGEV